MTVHCVASVGADVFRASLAPKKAVSFMSDKPIEIELEGELLAVDGETAPFYIDRPVTV
ncbi:hypothetical protein ACET8P_03160 [Aeromonas veronii]